MRELIHTSYIRAVQANRARTNILASCLYRAFEEPVPQGIHTAIADFYGVKPIDKYPSTLDHIIGAVGG